MWHPRLSERHIYYFLQGIACSFHKFKLQNGPNSKFGYPAGPLLLLLLLYTTQKYSCFQQLIEVSGEIWLLLRINT